MSFKYQHQSNIFLYQTVTHFRLIDLGCVFWRKGLILLVFTMCPLTPCKWRIRRLNMTTPNTAKSISCQSWSVRNVLRIWEAQIVKGQRNWIHFTYLRFGMLYMKYHCMHVFKLTNLQTFAPSLHYSAPNQKFSFCLLHSHKGWTQHHSWSGFSNLTGAWTQ